MRGIAAATTIVIALSLGACASNEAGDGTYPDLREAPRSTIANQDQAHWDAAQREMAQAAAALRAHPRAQYTPPDDPAAFVDQARSDLEATRRSHETAPPAPAAAPAPPAPNAQ
jgi:hypothetical protein